jgi:hypothetical protein
MDHGLRLQHADHNAADSLFVGTFLAADRTPCFRVKSKRVINRLNAFHVTSSGLST